MSAIENPLPVTSSESKSARKKRAKAESAQTNGTATAVPETPANEPSDPAQDGSYEHAHVKELQKQIRSINKRLTGLQKTDAVIGENPGVSLDELVKQKKLNNDQRAAAEKKPQLVSQLQQLEEHVKVFKSVDADYQSQIQRAKDESHKEHQKELSDLREQLETEGKSTSASELRKKLLVFSQFLRTAAAKRNVEDTSDPLENEAFEGALLLAYGGDEKAVETAVRIIEGSEEKVPNIEGIETEIKYSQIRKASIEATPYQDQEAWIDSVNEATAAVSDAQQPTEPEDTSVPAGSDPTLAHAGLTELETPQTNGTSHHETDTITSPIQASAGDEAGNLAGDAWDTGAGAQQAELADEGFEMVPRPNEEVDTPVPMPSAPVASEPAVEGLLQQEKTSWADEATAASGQDVTGNQAGEAWDLKPAGQTTDDSSFTAVPTESTPTANGWADSPADPTESTNPGTAVADDGFQQIASRHPGRGGGRGRGDRGDFRGRARGRGRGDFSRGDGDFRGGRGGRGGFRGDRPPRGDGGEFRGRGRGRGGPPRGAAQV